MPNPKTVIYDGDMGGDDLWAITFLVNLHQKNIINLIGISTCFGNVDIDQATRNAIDFLSYINEGTIPVYKGSRGPINDVPPLLDSAFGANGLSLAHIPATNKAEQNIDAVSWIMQAVDNADGPISIICTGPLTNIAKIFDQHPDLDQKSVEILWFGGAICPTGGGHKPVIESNGENRIGNITQYAEFNAINDPVAAQKIAGLQNAKVTYMPLDASQHMDVSLSKITDFLSQMATHGKSDLGLNLALMLHDVAKLDEKKLNAKGSYIHDVQLIQYFMDPDLFLEAVPICNIKFHNDEEKARSFDAKATHFDFSLLGHHGQMTAEKAQESNHYIVPGLITFSDHNSHTESDLEEMIALVERRWENLVEFIAS